MKKKIIIIACLAAFVLPGGVCALQKAKTIDDIRRSARTSSQHAVGSSAEDNTNMDPLMGAKELGDKEPGQNVAYYWIAGTIDSINEEKVLVDDRQFLFSYKTRFYSAKGKALTRYNFHKGTKVKVVLKTGDSWYVVSMVQE